MKEKWHLSSIEYWYKDIKTFFRRNGNAFWKEVIQTQELVIILARMASLQKVSSEEKKLALNQFKDLGKMGFAFSIFMVPGGSLLLPLVAKLLPWNLLPDSFKEQVKDEIQVSDDFFFKTEQERMIEIQKELGVNVERKKIYNLLDDFKIARKKYGKNKKKDIITDFYILPNYHHFALLSKHLNITEDQWNDSIEIFNWKKMKEMLDYVDGNLFRRSFEREALVIIEHFEELIKHRLNIEIALMVSFDILKKTLIINQNTCIIYISVETFWKTYPDIKYFKLELAKTIGKILRPFFHLPYKNNKATNIYEMYRELNTIERFINLLVSFIFVEKICHGIEDYLILELELDKFKSITKTYSLALEGLKDKIKQNVESYFLPSERYIGLILSRKLIKKYSYNEIVHLPDYIFIDIIDSL